MGEAVEIVKALVSPAEKLIDNISKGIGIIYKPFHERKMADSEAYKIKTISEAIQGAIDLPVTYNSGEISMDSTDINGLIQRANHRQALQAVRKQQNIETIVDMAYEMLENASPVEDTPVDEDWLNRFFDAAENVSSEEMQVIWAKILAGEVEKPRRFSMRTLEIVRNLSASEAEIFQKVLPLTLCIGPGLGVVSDDDLLKKYGVNYKNIVDLDDYGLINSSILSINSLVSKSISTNYHAGNRLMIISSCEEISSMVSLGCYKLTKSAEELASILTYEQNGRYFDDVAEMLYNSEEKEKLIITLHMIDKIVGDRITYQSAPYKTIPEKA